MEHFAIQLAIIIFSVKIAGSIAVSLGQPSVFGKLLIGVLIGPAVLDIVQLNEALQVFSHMGVLFLMFFAGLETDVEDLNANRNAALSVALGGILFPFLGGYLMGTLMGMNIEHAIFLGFIFSATSVSISVQTFRELGEMGNKTSTTVLGAALVDDIAVVVMLAVAMSFFEPTAESISWVLFTKVLFFVVIGLASWKLVPFAMDKMSKLKVSEPVISIAVVLCLVFASVAESLGVAGIIGSFAAGLAIAMTRHKKVVIEKLEPIAYTIFVPVFFASIGLEVKLSGIWENLPVIIGLSLFAILTKLIGSGLGAKLLGFNTLDSLIIGAGMVSRGEVALIIASMGITSKLINAEQFTVLVVVVLITTVATPPILKYLLGRSKKENEQLQMKSES